MDTEQSVRKESMEVVDDDGHQRTGTVWTATSHAITAVIGSGVLALPWSVAQLGWTIGPATLVACAYITYYTANLLSDCYRSPDGKRNYTYMHVVRSCLGARDVFVCGIAQYTLLWGSMIGYTITVAMSMMAVERSNCFHHKGPNAKCGASGNLYMIIFGLVEILLSQFPNLEKITVLSVVAAAMSFTYSFIALALCIAKFASHGSIEGTSLGVKIAGDVSASTKVWQSLQALGNIAFAYTYSMLLIEIQDTLKSPPPENKTMKRATRYGIGVTTMFYVSLGCVGYAAFGNTVVGNILTGFYNPFWLVDIANIAVVIHLVGAYQVYGQPIYAKYEEWLANKWPESAFFHNVYAIRSFKFTLCKLVLRTAFVVLTTLIAMMLPFFNAVVGLLGSVAFWPLTVYFPVTMYMTRNKIKRGHNQWFALQALSVAALLVSLLAAIGSIADIAQRLKHATIFKTQL
ncbi:Amino acid transporters domain-containing protein [Dioscorea alata]|uniref:Amino acid transporters domain-containing protein n=2 Tax=Dioscorea alata TaxID=55571 RepID=A0ACB7UT08_DIOAL|nr:Amino acid transporters domain-containing protein [Dioscorea alata]